MSMMKTSQSDLQKNEEEVVINNEDASTHFIGDINIAESSDNLHIGAELIFQQPVFISGVTMKDIVCIENYANENQTKQSGRTVKEKGSNIKNKIFGGLSLKLYILFCATIALIELAVFYYFIFPNTISGNLDRINASTINEMNYMLENFIPRVDWGMDNNCAFECSIKRKSKVRIVIPNSNDIFSCTPEKTSSCMFYIDKEYKKYINFTVPFNDIYYNYFFGLGGEIFQGRSLTCPFDDEPLLSEDHSSTIIIAVEDCFPDNLFTQLTKSVVGAFLNRMSGLVELINHLKRYKIISENYVVELPDICINTKFSLEMSKIHSVSYYNNQFYTKFDTLDFETVRNLLFLPDDTNITNFVNITYRESLNSTLPSINSCLNSTQPIVKNLNKVTLRLLFRLPKDTEMEEYSDVESCKSEMVRLIAEDYELRQNVINYFVFTSGFIFQMNSVNCSFNLHYDNFVSSIVIIGKSSKWVYEKTDNGIKLLANSLRSVARDIRKIVNFTYVDVEALCNSNFDQSLLIPYFYSSDLIIINEKLRKNAFVETDLSVCE